MIEVTEITRLLRIMRILNISWMLYCFLICILCQSFLMDMILTQIASPTYGSDIVLSYSEGSLRVGAISSMGFKLVACFDDLFV